MVKNLALSALEEEIGAADVERVLAAQARPESALSVPLGRPYREAREAFERAYFEHLLAAENGSMSRVAEKCGLERTHLYRKLKALGLTESLHPGYRLSPRGAALLEALGRLSKDRKKKT